MRYSIEKHMININLYIYRYIYIHVYLYNNVTSVCIFIGCWPWSIKGHTHRWRQILAIHVSRLVFLFSCPKNPSINHLDFYWIKTNRLHFPVCVYCNRSQKTSQRVKDNSHATRLRLVSYFFCSLHAVTSSVIYYSTHTEKCYLFVKYMQ